MPTGSIFSEALTMTTIINMTMMMTCHVSQYDGTNSDIVEHIQVIYQICRGHRFDKTRKLIHKHSLKMEHIMPMAIDTELFAAVLVASTRIQP